MLTVEGSKSGRRKASISTKAFSARPFRRTFNLATYVQVNGASFQDGLLKIALVREVPER